MQKEGTKIMSKQKSNREEALQWCFEKDEEIEDLQKQCDWLFNCLVAFTILNLVTLGCLVLMLFK